MIECGHHRYYNTTEEVVMAMSRIQFQPGLSLNQFLDLENYGTEAQCKAVLEKARWNDFS